ncbi:hypothetical protein SAMN04488563_1305 [Jiangella alkaliphila]|uniref:Uncharacterized protein n=1 Tax=Jiangella alkaliphila TaxID=419479 RepID=A0A1H2HXK3_9ACTN|nr:hypothetical protein SAMN04488563_1305 [Jiangella alkaliphila]
MRKLIIAIFAAVGLTLGGVAAAAPAAADNHFCC